MQKRNNWDCCVHVSIDGTVHAHITGVRGGYSHKKFADRKAARVAIKALGFNPKLVPVTTWHHNGNTMKFGV